MEKSLADFIQKFCERYHLNPNEPSMTRFVAGKGRSLKQNFVPWLELAVVEFQDYLAGRDYA